MFLKLYLNISILHLMYADVPTISRMRVSMDETGVEYLLSECSDQFICSLENKYLMK